jgi:GxxExxY protein
MHHELTRKIIGAAMRVYNTLGSGFLESVYQKAFCVELSRQGLVWGSQVPISVLYEAEPVGFFFADVSVEKTVIVELKATESLAKIHEVQLVNYLKATGLDVGMLIKFSPKTLEYKRKTRILDPVNPSESS